MRDWVTNVRDTHYMLGSVLGPHPFPMMVRDFHRVIGARGDAAVRRSASGDCPTCWSRAWAAAATRSGCSTRSSATPACAWWASRRAAAGSRRGQHAARFRGGRVGVLHGTRTLVLQDARRQIRRRTRSRRDSTIPAIGPEHAWLADQGRAEYTHATDDEALDAFETLSRSRASCPRSRAPTRSRGCCARGSASPRGARDRQPLRPRRQGRADGRRDPRRAPEAHAAVTLRARSRSLTWSGPPPTLPWYPLNTAIICRAPVAQLDRAPASGAGCRGSSPLGRTTPSDRIARAARPRSALA